MIANIAMLALYPTTREIQPLINEENDMFDALSLRIREKLLNPILQVNLREMCLRKVVINLWNSDDMLISIQNFKSGAFFAKKSRGNLERQMKNKVLKLGLPEPLQKELLPLIGPIGWEILRWRAFQERLLRKSLKDIIDKHVLKQLRWTCIGAIDYVKTMRELLRREVFDVEEMYVLACGYCLENEIRVLWELLPVERKREYGDVCDVSKVRCVQLEYYWPYILKGQEHLLPKFNCGSFNNYAFLFSATYDKKIVAEYFFHKLTSQERESSLINAFSAVKRRQSANITLDWNFDYAAVQLADVVYFLLSVMDPTRQKRILKMDYFTILLCLRNWPWHELFLDVMDLIWTFLPDEHTAKKYQIEALWNNSEYSPHLFQKVFKHSPKYFRKCFVTSEVPHCIFFRECFFNGDAETLKVVLRNVDLEDRLRLVSCNAFLQLVDYSIIRNERKLFEASFEGCMLSEKNKNGLINAYKKFLELSNQDEESRVHRLKKAFDLLDNVETGASNMRNLGDGTVTRRKKTAMKRKR